MRTPTLLLGTATGLALVGSLAVAADRRVEGLVKAVDAERSTITVTTQAGASSKDEMLDVVKKAKVTFNGRAATLKDVRRGQRAVAVVNDELEVVTKLDATGEGIAPLVPEVTVVNELPGPDAPHVGPWVSADGLTLYWKDQSGVSGKAWIWSARRKTKDALFEDARRLVPGNDMTVSRDGLEMILLQADGLWTTTRPSLDAGCSRPRRVVELQGHGFLAAPCFGGDDLVLYASRVLPNQPVTPVKFTRANRRAKWAGPTPVKIALPAGKQVHFFSVTPDGSRAFGVVSETRPGKTSSGGPNGLAMMRSEGGGFGRPQVIRIDGEPLHGIFPRYVPATNELFLSRSQEGKPSEIVLVRNFDPDAIETAAVKPTRPDRESIQGRWISVSEVVGGTPLTPEQVRDMNKRLEVRGSRFVISRTGLNGKFGVYDGTFRLDPSADPKTFDWDGKVPSGASAGLRGIYELDGGTLRLCYVEASSGMPRPTEMRSSQGSRGILVVFKRDGK